MEKEIQNIPQKNEKVRRWIFSDIARVGVRYVLIFSIIIFTVYTAGSMPDPGFSDRLLFILLRILRYSSLTSCAFSLFALGFSVQHLVNNPSLSNFFRIFIYFFTGILSAVLAMLDSFIIVATEGNL
ncbi:MAG: hypothetical protein FWG89_02165 [Treponema sp.]|nr:hypothetical protein [Treponema sp.]